MIRGIVRVVVMMFLALVFVSGAFSGGYVLSQQYFRPAPPPSGGMPENWQPSLKVFWEAWNYVKQDFYKTPVNESDMMYGAVGGMVQSLGDPHTGFSEPKIAAINSTQLQGSFEGIGATVEMREGRLTVVSPIKGSPAEKAGILPNDTILQVDDTVIQNMDVNSAVSLIRGPKGSTVKLVIQRTKVPNFTVSIVRDTIRLSLIHI